MVANKWDERKKAKEDEYFVKQERELLAKLKAKQEGEAKVSAQKACYMKCPKCGEPLKERTFQKILIDQCTGCNGICVLGGFGRPPGGAPTIFAQLDRHVTQNFIIRRSRWGS